MMDLFFVRIDEALEPHQKRTRCHRFYALAESEEQAIEKVFTEKMTYKKQGDFTNIRAELAETNTISLGVVFL